MIHGIIKNIYCSSLFSTKQLLLNKHCAILSTLPYNIIIVDDGSNDDVKNIVRNYPVIFISHAVNLGQGAALQTGMELAKKMDAEIVIHFDADGQHAAADINKLVEPIINNECDIVFGSRFLNNQSSQNIPFVKKIVLQIARYVNWLYTGILLSDAHNGLRALNKKAIDTIVISENKMAHASEILYLTKKNNLRYKEVPVTISIHLLFAKKRTRHFKFNKYSYTSHL